MLCFGPPLNGWGNDERRRPPSRSGFRPVQPSRPNSSSEHTIISRRARQPFRRRCVYRYGHATGTSELTSEDELIRRAQRGDLEAFGGLARVYERRVYALALHYCRRPEDAEDLSQDVWLKAFRSLGGFRFESNFYTWLCRITVNTFLNHKRSGTVTRDGETTAVRLDSLEELLEEPSSRNGAEEDIQRKVLAERVISALGELT